MRILIMDTSGKSEYIEVNENETVKDLKDKLANKKGINSEIKLHYGGEILNDNDIISSLDIMENDTVLYLLAFRGGK
jgi:hypothetical protein